MLVITECAFVFPAFPSLQSQAHVFLTMADLPSAQQTIRTAVELINSFPMLLQQLRPSLHFLLGLYCHTSGAFGHAYSCFMVTAVSAHPSFCLRTL
jgi:hypothetical protein